ncbi:hypothetical protein, partial [Vibrio sagamiensis]|uniref:hypothetical protein n=1 Tax=Vibrio sagamiensis TaxID=512650 RepID=UPI000587261F
RFEDDAELTMNVTPMDSDTPVQGIVPVKATVTGKDWSSEMDLSLLPNGYYQLVVTGNNSLNIAA